MAGPTDMVGQLFIIASDKTQIEVGETVHFSISYDENRTPENDIDIYINNDFLESIPVGPSPVLFNYTFEEDGIFYLYATTVGTPESNTIAINVDEATPQTQSNSVSWIINNKTVSSLEMNNKEIQSIVTSDNVVLYNINSSEYDAISLSSDKNILSYVDSESCTLSAQLTNNQSSAAIEGEIVTFTIYDTNDDIMTSLIGITDSTGLADVSYSSYGIGDIYVKASVGNIVSSEVYIEDIYWYSDDGTKLFGTYSTDSDSSYSYITNIEANVEFPHIPTGNFELSMKAYRPTITTYRALLIEFGENKTNTLLCGWDDGNTSTTKNCRIYRRIGSINASVQNDTNPQYNNEEWVDFKLRFEEGTVTLTIGGTSISTTISSVSRIGNYSPTSSKLSEFKIKLLTKNFDGVSLTSDKSILSYADSESVTLTAQLTSDGSPVSVSGETVSFYDGETLIGSEDTDSTGVATFISSNFDVGSHSLTAVCSGCTSNSVSVTVNKLPSGYQEVEYIENTETSYIDTGFKPNNNTRTYIRFYAGTLGTNIRAIFGSRDATTYNDSYTSFYLGSNTTSTGRMRVDYYNTNSNNIYLFPNTSDKTEYELDYNKNIVTLNGATHTFTPQTFNSNNNIFLFTCNNGGIADDRMMIGKIYACKIWDNEVLIRNLIPCYRISDNLIGLYDIVNDVFYTNAGTGTFSKGPDVTPAEYDGVSLTVDENILSYADGDTCTLTAQLTDDGSPASVEGVTVEFFNGSTSLGSALTDSNGIATKVYSSTGEGDVVFTAISGNIYSTNVNVEDCIRYDNATSDKTSNYGTHNLNSLTFNSDHYEAYRSVGTSLTSTFYSPVYIDDTLPQNFEMSVMYNSSKMNTEQIEFIIAPNHPKTYSGTTELGIIVTDVRRGLFHRVNGSATWYTESSTLSNDVWYTFYLKIEETTVTAKILDENNNTIYTSTQTISTAQDYKKWSIINGGNSRTLYFKNLKIKPL